MYRALYRKWRPRDFDEVCGQSQVTDILRYQVSEGRVSHAYLFCGSRGTGKTTCAKILAKAVNCLRPVNGNPCHECEACRAIDSGTAVDVIEMDAASNNGVDDVRDMKEEISFTPAQLTWRVYIIDEVHMMSASAFNALLKTLEEPPAHVLFILATTELQKLPATIISRCQRFDFRRIGTQVLMDRLQYIAGEEKIPLTEPGARAIARLAQGGMRDAISLLELCASAGTEITEDTVAALVGGGNRSDIYDMTRAIAEKDYARVFSLIDRTVMSGADLGAFWQSLSDMYRDMLITTVLPAEQARAYLDLTDREYAELSQMAAAFTRPVLMYHSRLIEATAQTLQRPGITKRSAVELTLTRMCDPKLSKDPEALLVRIEALEKEVARLRAGVPAPTAAPPATSTPADTPAQAARPAAAPSEAPKAAPASPARPPQKAESLRPVKGWRDVLATFETVKPAFMPVLRTARAAVSSDGQLVLSMKRDFVSDMFQKDEATLRLLLTFVCEADPDCRPEAGIRFDNTAGAVMDDTPFSF